MINRYHARLLLCVPCLAATLGCAAAPGPQTAAERPDGKDGLLIADFESADYGNWRAEGEAFGPGPAEGTLDNQMPVRGYAGRRLVNSYYGGDGTTGRLTSPAFTIERDYIHFLIGGGQQPDHLSMRLLIDGETARAATGNQDRQGGEERLDLRGWDVKQFKGKTAQIEIIDNATGGWGHLTVDHILQSNERPPIPATEVTRDIPRGTHAINLPVSRAAPMRRMKVLVDGREQREFDIQFAEPQEAADFWVRYDISAFAEQGVTLWVHELNDKESINLVRLNDDWPTDVAFYEETYRPQFHFTSRRGWLNDPNGLVYHDGTWHLYYQHNPFGTQWDNMTWGHATSTDLFHWEQQPIGVHPKNAEDMAYSGTAVIDHGNTSGFGTADNPAIVAAFTSTGRGECITYSTDGGKTFTEYAGNPVVRHQGRDPRIFWYEPGGHWSMVLYDESEGKRWFTFYTSPDLKQWTYQSHRPDWFECPDLVELNLEGKPGESRWMLFDAGAQYELGGFDGKAFTPEHQGRHQLFYGDCYAGQRYSDAPDERVVYIGWSRHLHRSEDHQQRGGMPFNQQMTVPMDFTLIETADGPRVCAMPVREIEGLRTRSNNVDRQRLTETPHQLPGGELLDLALAFEIGDAESVTLDVRGREVRYSAADRTLTCGHVTAPVQLIDGRLTLRVLVDRMSIEVFVNSGRQVLIDASIIDPDNREVSVRARGRGASLVGGQVHELGSAWR